MEQKSRPYLAETYFVLLDAIIKKVGSNLSDWRFVFAPSGETERVW